MKLTTSEIQKSFISFEQQDFTVDQVDKRGENAMLLFRIQIFYEWINC